MRPIDKHRVNLDDHGSLCLPGRRGRPNSGRRRSSCALWCVVLALTFQGCATTNSATPDPQPPAQQSNEQRVKYLVEMAERGLAGDVRQALDYGADVNGKTKDGRTALNEATRRGYLEIMELLIARGADVNAKDDARTSGWLGCWNPVPECYFLGYSPGGSTALHMVARYAQTLEASRAPRIKQMVGLLIAHGADINASTKAGDTPLHYASWRLEEDLVELLIAHGADVNAKDKNGDTPLTYARTSPLYGKKRSDAGNDDSRLVELIRQHGGK